MWGKRRLTVIFSLKSVLGKQRDLSFSNSKNFPRNYQSVATQYFATRVGVLIFFMVVAGFCSVKGFVFRFFKILHTSVFIFSIRTKGKDYFGDRLFRSLHFRIFAHFGNRCF